VSSYYRVPSYVSSSQALWSIPHPIVGTWHRLVILYLFCFVLVEGVFIIAFLLANHSSLIQTHQLKVGP
jgi:hypothetical protein